MENLIDVMQVIANFVVVGGIATLFIQYRQIKKLNIQNRRLDVFRKGKETLGNAEDAF